MEGNTALQDENEQEDIISKLPDEILIQILSLLPTVNVVRTCILSSRWKNLWLSVYSFKFDDESYPSTYYNGRTVYAAERRKRFVYFMERVTSLCQSKNIQNFNLSCSRIRYNSLIASWITFALNRNVCNLTLFIDMGKQMPQKFPQSILTCKTLVKLSVHTDFALDIPHSVVCFPSLKILSFQFLCTHSDLISKLLCSCLVLEELTLYLPRRSPYVKMLNFDIFIPTLRRLSIDSNNKFVVRTCNLEYLKISSSMCYLANEMPFVSKAFVEAGRYTSYNLSRDEANCVMELLRGINNTKILSLSVHKMAALSLAFNGDFPTFPNLKHLKLESGSGWKLLPHFLSSSPNLEVLVLKKSDYGKSVSMDFDEDEAVPSCLLHVKFIEITYPSSTGLGDDDLEVVKYLLKNGEVLEKFWLCCCLGSVSRSIRKEIRSCPKGSKACKINMNKGSYPSSSFKFQ